VNHDQFSIINVVRVALHIVLQPERQGKISCQYDRAERLSLLLFCHFDTVSGPSPHLSVGHRGRSVLMTAYSGTGQMRQYLPS